VKRSAPKRSSSYLYGLSSEPWVEPRPVGIRSHMTGLAHHLLSLGPVYAVHLFGSTAREENFRGSDIDLVLSVSEQDFQKFLASLKEKMDEFDDFLGYHAAFMRFFAARAVLGQYLALAMLLSGTDPSRVDLFLFPSGWLARLDELQEKYPYHDDPRFMRNIAADARRYDPLKRSFEPKKI